MGEHVKSRQEPPARPARLGGEIQAEIRWALLAAGRGLYRVLSQWADSDSIIPSSFSLWPPPDPKVRRQAGMMRI